MDIGADGRGERNLHRMTKKQMRIYVTVAMVFTLAAGLIDFVKLVIECM